MMSEDYHVKITECSTIFRVINGHRVTDKEWADHIQTLKGREPFVKLEKPNLKVK